MITDRHVTFFAKGRTKVIKNWRINYNINCNKLYVVHGGRAYYIENNLKHYLVKDHIYLFPRNKNIRFYNDPDDPIDHTYFDFILSPPMVLNQVVKLQLEYDPLLKSAINVIVKMFQRYPKPNFEEEQILKHSLMCVLYFINKIVPFDTVSDQRILTTLDYIHKNFNQPIEINQLASMVYLEKNYFIKLFEKNMNITPYQYIKNYRFEMAFKKIKGGMNIQNAALSVGFSSVAAFSNAVKKHFGISPKDLCSNIL